jgi:tryptophan-rich sensory protein
MSGSLVLASLAWAVLAAYLAVAGMVVYETDFRTPRDVEVSPGVVCLVALVFAAAWPIRALQRLAARER